MKPPPTSTFFSALVLIGLVAIAQADTASSIDWSKARHAFFTSPRDFAVDHEGIKLRFRFNGLGWKLHELDLQLPKAAEEKR